MLLCFVVVIAAAVIFIHVMEMLRGGLNLAEAVNAVVGSGVGVGVGFDVNIVLIVKLSPSPVNDMKAILVSL